jgi:nucleotide-binding universal stress UspA family protein
VQSLAGNDRTELKKRLAETEARFRAAVQHRARDIEWRCAMVAPTEYVAREARAADLVITGSNRDGILLDRRRRLDPSSLVMQVGRPIFLVPPEVEYLRLQSVLVAWKDTREARRALADSVPLLQKAKDITVLEVIEGDASPEAAQRRVDDVSKWLGRHDILAFPLVKHAKDEADQIERIWQSDADVVIAGAYGHKRLQEWVFGGFTECLITRSRRCSFLAH